MLISHLPYYSLYYFFLFSPFILYGINYSEKKLETLYNSLDPKSIPQHLAFYQLYNETNKGKEALQVIIELISPKNLAANTDDLKNKLDPFTLNATLINTLVNLISKGSDNEEFLLNESDLLFISEIGKELPNRKLKGHFATKEAEILLLPPSEIDLARAVFLSQFENEKESLQKRETYEAMIDLMALQILAKIPSNADAKTKIAAINELIFEEMGFRFPPHSLYAKEVDIYTFLPSVLDSRRGVCLGVSILYISIAQRLDLPLEMVTPPGHIYVRYRNGEEIINIETTARGVHLDCEEYLSIDTKKLELRNIKEVIGLAHYNLASTFWQRSDPQKTIEAYLKAKPYLEEDEQLKELLGFAYLLNGQKEEGEKLLLEVKNTFSEYSVSKDSMAAEYLEGVVGIEGIRAFFKPVDETRSSILEKREALKACLKETPRFASGYFSLAVAWLQLHREKEALEALEIYHRLESENPTAEYYLSVLYMQRYQFKKAWEHYFNAEKLVKAHAHAPKTLKELRKELSSISAY